METIIFKTSFFGNGKRSLPKVVTEAKSSEVVKNSKKEIMDTSSLLD